MCLGCDPACEVYHTGSRLPITRPGHFPNHPPMARSERRSPVLTCIPTRRAGNIQTHEVPAYSRRRRSTHGRKRSPPSNVSSKNEALEQFLLLCSEPRASARAVSRLRQSLRWCVGISRIVSRMNTGQRSRCGREPRSRYRTGSGGRQTRALPADGATAAEHDRHAHDSCAPAPRARTNGNPGDSVHPIRRFARQAT